MEVSMAPLIKVILSAVLIVIIAEASKKAPTLGALIASLPLLSILGMIWLYLDTRDPELIAVHATGTFWFVLPSLPLFLLLPWLLRRDWSFAWALILSCTLTITLYGLMLWLFSYLGVEL